MVSLFVLRHPIAALSMRRAIRDLDKAMPGWEDGIDTERLNLSSKDSCVLGQLFAHLGGRNGSTGFDVAVTYGLNNHRIAYAVVRPSEWDLVEAMERQWKRIIRHRQAAKAALLVPEAA